MGATEGQAQQRVSPIAGMNAGAVSNDVGSPRSSVSRIFGEAQEALSARSSARHGSPRSQKDAAGVGAAVSGESQNSSRLFEELDALVLSDSFLEVVVDVDEGRFSRDSAGLYGWIATSTGDEANGERMQGAAATLAACRDGGYSMNGRAVRLYGIEDLVSETRVLRVSDFPAMTSGSHGCEIGPGPLWRSHVGCDPVEVAREISMMLQTCLIAEGSAYRLGGGFLSGDVHSHQETLCLQSTYFPSLLCAEQKAHARAVTPSVAVQSQCAPGGGRWKCFIPADGLIFSPCVEIFRGGIEDGYPFLQRPVTLAAAISLSMPNCNEEVTEAPLDIPADAERYRNLLRTKFYTMLSTAEMIGATGLVIPDVGCGMLKNDPVEVAKALGEVVYTQFPNVFKEIHLVGSFKFCDAAERAGQGNLAMKTAIGVQPAFPSDGAAETPRPKSLFGGVPTEPTYPVGASNSMDGQGAPVSVASVQLQVASSVSRPQIIDASSVQSQGSVPGNERVKVSLDEPAGEIAPAIPLQHEGRDLRRIDLDSFGGTRLAAAMGTNSGSLHSARVDGSETLRQVLDRNLADPDEDFSRQAVFPARGRLVGPSGRMVPGVSYLAPSVDRSLSTGAVGHEESWAGRLQPRAGQVLFDDPRGRRGRLGIVAFSKGERIEPCDRRCSASFLGNYYDLGPNGLPVLVNCLAWWDCFSCCQEVQYFRNAEAAFQSLKYWRCGRASEFENLTGSQAVEKSEQLIKSHDRQVAGFNNMFAAMMHVLRGKFSVGSPFATALLKTDEDYLIHHVTNEDDPVWSDDSYGFGTNWLGMQLMLIRDSLRRSRYEDETLEVPEWTAFIETCIDTQTGLPISTEGFKLWQTSVLSAAEAVLGSVQPCSSSKALVPMQVSMSLSLVNFFNGFGCKKNEPCTVQ